MLLLLLLEGDDEVAVGNIWVKEGEVPVVVVADDILNKQI